MSPFRADINPTRFLQANNSNHSVYQGFGKTDCGFFRRNSNLTLVSQCSTIHLQEIVTLLGRLGFLINVNKCFQHPSQRLIFLGTMLNTFTLYLYLPNEKVDLIQQGARQPHTKGKGTLQELASLRGRMSHAAQNGIWLALLSYRALQRVHLAGAPRSG